MEVVSPLLLFVPIKKKKKITTIAFCGSPVTARLY